MLVLSRKRGEKFYIGANICITVLDMHGGKIRIGIDAPRDLSIWRDELRPTLPQRGEKDTYHPTEEE